MPFHSRMPEDAITIRLATTADAEALSRLAAKTFPLGCPADTDPRHLEEFIATELTADRFCEFIAGNGVTILLAEAAGELAGFAMLVSGCAHPLIKAERPIELRKCYVDPTHHGRGVAQRLLRAAMPLLDDHDVAWLSVFSGNARAISFYRSSGFEVVGTHYFNVGGDPQKDFVMRREGRKSK